MKRVLILGAGGFVGRTMLATPSGSFRGAMLEFVAPTKPVELTDQASVSECVRDARADHVVHLAAQTFVPESFKDPEGTFRVNFLGTLNVLRSLQATDFAGTLLYVSSGDVYGLVPPQDLPVGEDMPPRPRSPYAVSKVAAEALCFQWSQTEGTNAVIARPFNHIGPGQSERFVVSDFARQIVEIKLGRREPLLRVGDIDVARDFTDVRDVIRAYVLLLDRGIRGEIYNICSGKEQAIRSLLEKMLELSGVQAPIETDPRRLRKQEQRRMAGSYSKLNGATGWNPEISINASLRAILNHWETELKDE